MVQDSQEILKNMIGPLPPTPGIGLVDSCYFEPEMGISRMNEFHISEGTLFISFNFVFNTNPFNRHGHAAGPDADLPGDLRQRNHQFPV
jgi:hypothetical protein